MTGLDAEIAAHAGFQLDADPLLSRSTVEFGEEWRDSDDLAMLWKGSWVVRVDASGKAPVTDDRLERVPATEFGEQPPPAAVLLGVEGGTGYWAVRSGGERAGGERAGGERAGVVRTEQSGQPQQWLDLRRAGGALSDTDAGLLTTAVGLLGWHGMATYCAVCGASTRAVRAGWARRCSGCDREEYPRTDPSMICLVHDGADHVLLARQEKWPSNRFSVLAGFVEVGESLEACVRREVLEEVGVRVDQIRYLGSQPWPFPRSLMIGFAAVADSAAPLHPAPGEIAEARWVHREQVRAMTDWGSTTEGIQMPPGVSIAHRMLRGWAGAHA